MKSVPLALFCLVLAAPMTAHAGEQLIPAGALIRCTISEPRFSSKTANIGDPVLCQVGYGGAYSHFNLPYNSYLGGRFEAYKDPGHFVGKGWMELEFDHVVIEPDTVIPMDARVVGVSGYNVDRQGRILGRGHPVRDTVEWMLPILWPIDLINLPRRGPRPTLKAETRLTLKVMDDFVVPGPEPLEDRYGLRHRAPTAYDHPAPAPAPPLEAAAAPAPAPPAQRRIVISDVPPPRPDYVRTPATPAPVSGSYAYSVPPRPVYVSPHAEAWTPRTYVVYRNGVP
jgi:hypothetical protein